MRFNLLFLALFLFLAGCTVPVASQPITATPGPLSGAVILSAAQSTAEAAAWDATATIAARMATVSAATESAARADTAIRAATLQVEQFNIEATKQAISINATATAAALDLRARIAAVTATAAAQAFTDSQGTLAAVDAENHALDLQARRAGESINQVLRMSGALFLIGLGMIVLIAASLAGARLVVLAAQWSNYVLARQSIDWENGVIINRAGKIELLPGFYEELPAETEGAPAAAPADEPAPSARDERLYGAITNRSHNTLADYRADAKIRAARAGWRNAALAFLKWANYPGPTGAARGLGLRQAREAGYTDEQWKDLTALLSSLGFIMKDGAHDNAPWVIAPGPAGAPFTIREILQSSIWSGEFDYPSTLPPNIAPPVANSPRHGTAGTARHDAAPCRTA